MVHQWLLARLALSGVCALQGLATVAIDFNRTHATNPLWPGHARFHLVWQTITVALLSCVELALVWAHGPYEAQAFSLALVLAAVSPLGFLAACVGRRLFGGTLFDPNGIQPLRVALLGRVRSLDMNLVAVLVALVSLAAIAGICRM